MVLQVIREGGRELWVRQFGSRRFVTVCRRKQDGTWFERFWCLEYEFRPRQERNVTHHEQQACRFTIGFVSVRIPFFLAPRAAGSEEIFDDDRVSVCVVVRAPLVGKLLEYTGVVEEVGEEP